MYSRLVAVKMKKYIRPNNDNSISNSNVDGSINIVSTEKPIGTRRVPEIQTQIVNATQSATMTSTIIVATQDELSSNNEKDDTASEL